MKIDTGMKQVTKWYPFDALKGYRQKRPPIKKNVLVRLIPWNKSYPPIVAVGYRRNAAGCKDSPMFVTPGVPGDVIAWCDCLPDRFTGWDLWKISGDANPTGEIVVKKFKDFMHQQFARDML